MRRIIKDSVNLVSTVILVLAIIFEIVFSVYWNVKHVDDTDMRQLIDTWPVHLSVFVIICFAVAGLASTEA